MSTYNPPYMGAPFINPTIQAPPVWQPPQITINRPWYERQGGPSYTNYDTQAPSYEPKPYNFIDNAPYYAPYTPVGMGPSNFNAHLGSIAQTGYGAYYPALKTNSYFAMCAKGYTNLGAQSYTQSTESMQLKGARYNAPLPQFSYTVPEGVQVESTKKPNYLVNEMEMENEINFLNGFCPYYEIPVQDLPKFLKQEAPKENVAKAPIEMPDFNQIMARYNYRVAFMDSDSLNFTPQDFENETKVFTVKKEGAEPLENRKAFFINGILNSETSQRESAMHLLDVTGLPEVVCLHRCSYGFFGDLMEVFYNNFFNIRTNSVLMAENEFKKYLSGDDSNKMLLFQHSHGTLVGKMARENLDKEMVNRMQVESLSQLEYDFNPDLINSRHMAGDTDIVPKLKQDSMLNNYNGQGERYVVDAGPFPKSHMFTNDAFNGFKAEAARKFISD